MRNAIKALVYIGLLLISPEIFAGVFDPPPTDKSVSLLGIIFGANVGDIYLGGNPNSVLSDLMEKFNFIVVTVGLVVLAYTSIMATINTAQEGTAMGKKWSAVWIPLRSIAGMALMVPAPASGYSMIQVTVMWIVLQGIGAADQLWNIALNGLANGVSASAGSQSNPGLESAGKELSKKVLNAAICMESFYKASKNRENIDNGRWVASKGNFVKSYDQPSDEFLITRGGNQSATRFSQSDTMTVTKKGQINFGVDDDNDPAHQAVCGSLFIQGQVTSDEYPNYGSTLTQKDLEKAAQSIYDTKKLAISTMLSILKPLADGLVNETYDTNSDGVSDGSFTIPQNDSSAANPAGYLEAAANAYVSIMSQLVIPGTGGGPNGSVGGNALTSDQNNIKLLVDAGMRNGWITAGSFYFVFNQTLISKLFRDASTQISDEAPGSETGSIPSISDSCTNACLQDAYNKSISQPTSTDAPLQRIVDMDSLEDLAPDSEMKDLIQHLAYGKIYMNKTYGQASHSALSGGGAAAAIGGLVGGANADILNKVRAMFESKDKDPLIAHAQLGREIMIGTEVAWMASIVLATAGAVMAGIWMGSGLGLVMVTMTMLAMVWGFLASMWVFGATLAIYAPLIPFMIFTLAAVGWMLTVIEAVIAAPLIALGLTMPAGDEMGKLATALMLLANIFLRPLLMIFGFLLAGGLFKAVITLINFGMADVFETIQVNTAFSSLAVLFVYVSFVISVENLSFSLIYAVPDKILRWLGGPADSTNVGAMSEAKAGFEKSAGGAAQGGSQAIGQLNNAAIANRQAKAARSGGGDKPGAGGGGAGGAGGGGEPGAGGGGTTPPVPPA